MKISLKFSFVLVLLLLQQIATAQSAQAEAAITELMKHKPVVGLSVAVVKNNKLIYTQQFGYRDLENKLPLEENNLFRIASISKSFTATALMQMVAKRKVKLTDDVGDLVGFKVRNPNFPNKVITLAMLLSHTSSINDSEGYFSLNYINPEKNTNWQKAYNTYEPGSKYQYCNLNFNLAGTILERLSGERFDQYVVHHVLQPLGLYGGYCVDSLNKNMFAKIYDWKGDSAGFVHSPDAYAPRSEEIENYTMGYSAPVFSPTGGMKISTPDLARYMIMHMNYGKRPGSKRIIKKKNSKLMQEVHAPTSGYGYALLQTKELVPGRTLVGHTGSAYGLFSAMFFDPAKKEGIVLISNGCHPKYHGEFNSVLKSAFQILYTNFLK